MSNVDPFAPLAPEEAKSTATKARADKVPIVPVPDDAPPCNFKHPVYGAPVMMWEYRDSEGRLHGVDARFEYVESGKTIKQVLPLTYCQVGDKQGWRSKGIPAPRPLYGLDRLAARPEAPVVVAEGAKAADAAGQLLPDFVHVSWPGGANATDTVDWQSLAGRDVLIWPDRDRHMEDDGPREKLYADQPGTIAATNIIGRLGSIAASVRVLDLSNFVCKDGWDADDALAAGWSSAEAIAFVKQYSRSAVARPVIQVRAGALHALATTAETALLDYGAPFYVRGGIVRPVVDELPAAHGQVAKVARLCPVDGDTMVDHLSRAADWTKHNARKGEDVPTDPPRPVALTILARDGEWRFRRLAGVITTPTLRPDGTLLTTPGYDLATQLLLLDPPTLPKIPERPTRADALAAVSRLDGLLEEFPFVDAASRSAALSALITPVVRGAMPVAPLHATSAPVAGSGKSYIIDLASAISTGERAPVMAAGRTEEETEKRLGAALLSGQAIVSIDNVNGELGGDALCQMIERPVVSVRPLGSSKLVKIESHATMFATGNNIHLVGDMTRRVILRSLDPNVERPELRTFAGSPLRHVLADRGAFIAAALTIARAYVVAGFPDLLPPLASFEDWSRFARSPLVWLGRADPVETMNKARADDPVVTALRNLLTTWHGAVGSSPRTTGGIKEDANSLNPFGNLSHGALRDALAEVADDRRGGIDAKRLGHFLGRHHGRVVDGLKMVADDDKHAKQRLWKVVRA